MPECGHARPLPLLGKEKLPGTTILSGMISHGFSARRLRFPSRLLCTGKAGFRLPGRLYRTGFGFRLHPQGSSREFQLQFLGSWQPPFAPHLSWRYPIGSLLTHLPNPGL